MKTSKQLKVLLSAGLLSMPLVVGANTSQSYEPGVDINTGEIVDRLFGEGGARPGGPGDGKGDNDGDGKGGGGSTEGEGGA